MMAYDEAMQNLRKQVRTEYGAGSPENDYVDTTINRIQGLSEREDIMSKTNNAWDLASSVMYPAFLKASWSQNFLLQPNYVWTIAGVRPLAQAMWRNIGKKVGLLDKDIADAAERSAANFPSFMAKYHMPGSPFEQYSKMATTLNWFAGSDSFTRKLAAEWLIPHAENLITQWYKDPANPKYVKALKEGNINTDELMQRMLAKPRSEWGPGGIPPIPQEATMRYAQVMGNRAMGRTGVRSLPLWLSGDDRASKIFMALHRQVASNEGVFLRNLYNAPTAGVGLNRALRAVFGAEVAGALYQGLTNWILGNNFFDVNKSFVDSFGGHKEAAFAAKSLLMGIGTLSSGLIISGLNMYSGNYGGMGYGILAPPVAAFTDELIQKVAQGKLLDAAARLNPSQTLDVMKRRKEKDERKRKAATRSGFGIGGLRP
jgi:hypothetical protein